jgi:putative aldouronate transport system permease protein
VGVFAYSMLSDIGSLNSLLKFLGFSPVDFYNKPGLWPIILTLIIRWKVTGYGCVIYMATLAGVDSSYYEAAAIDGANKWQQIRHISLPMLKSIVIILTLLAIGRIMNADFGMFYAVIGDSSQMYPTTDVIDTFVYRSLCVTGDIRMASAAGSSFDFLRNSANAAEMSRLSAAIPSEGIKMAATIITIGPIVFVYPFLQKFFIKGIMVGAVKG